MSLRYLLVGAKFIFFFILELSHLMVNTYLFECSKHSSENLLKQAKTKLGYDGLQRLILPTRGQYYQSFASSFFTHIFQKR